MNDYRRCRFCGRVVIFDDERRVAAHEGPPCEGWKELFAQMVAAGLMRALPNEVHEVPEEILPVDAPTTTGLASEPGEGEEDDN